MVAKSVSHHVETIGNQNVCGFLQGDRIIAGILGWCRISSIQVGPPEKRLNSEYVQLFSVVYLGAPVESYGRVSCSYSHAPELL